MLDSIQPELADFQASLADLCPEHEMFREVILPMLANSGKLLRPQLVMLTARACEPDTPWTEGHRRLAKITELIHIASLVHDDFLDGAMTRRGRATCHISWDNRTAVLAGDYLLAMACHELSYLDNSIGRIYSAVLLDLCSGELLQSRSQGSLCDLQTYLHKSYQKTASLFRAACLCSAMLSNTPEMVSTAMGEFGRALGMAFQLTDDLLDYVSPDLTGKDSLSDLKNGIYTLPVILAAQQDPERTADSLAGSSVEDLLTVLHDTDAVRRSRQVATEYIDLAIAQTAVLADSIYRRDMITLAQSVLDRCS